VVDVVIGNPFERRLPDGALEYLETAAWWQDVLRARYTTGDGASRPLLIALRNYYINVYADGQSVLKITFDKSRGHIPPRCELHRKYDGREEIKPTYVPIDISRINEIALATWIERALCHGHDEKRGVAAIVARNSNVIDVEMGLPANKPVSPGDGKAAPRMDIVAIERDEVIDNLKLVFYEVKGFWNSGLRSRSLNPKLFDQLDKYEKYVMIPERRQQIVDAYRNGCNFIRMVHDARGTTLHPFIDAITHGAELGLDPKPRLVVFGCKDGAAAAAPSWRQHEAVLRQRYCLLIEHRAEDVALGPCRSSEDTHCTIRGE
jgi:hypothetical protein